MKTSQILRLLLASAVLMCCRIQERTELHIIPNGFTGAVVIVHGGSTCQKMNRSENGDAIYRIPTSGMLCVSSPEPDSGPYKRVYLFESAGNQNKKLPYNADPKELQVFHYSVGVTGGIDGKEIGNVHWEAYIVGVPSERSDWPQVREAKVEDAVREFVSHQSGPPK